MCVVAYLLSLPLWERGFKHLVYEPDYPWNMSLPLWERGFKHDHVPRGDHQHESLPLWERGFKHQNNMIGEIVANCRSPCGSVDLNKTADRGTYEVNPSLPLWECKEK